MKKSFTLMFLLLAVASVAQISDMEKAIFHIPENLEFSDGQYKMRYYTDATHYYIHWTASDSCPIEMSETDSLLVDMKAYFLNYPPKTGSMDLDTLLFVYYSRLYHKIFNQPILRNKNLNYFSAINPYENEYMVTAIVNDNGSVDLRSVHKADSSINNMVLNRIKSKQIAKKIRKIVETHVSPYEGVNYTIPAIIIEYKYQGKYNALPFLTFEAPEPYKMSYKLMRKLHRIAVRKIKNK